MARSDEMFDADSGVVHDGHYLTRDDVAFYAQGTQLDNDRWQQADKVEGHNGLQHKERLAFTSMSERSLHLRSQVYITGRKTK